MPRPRFKRAAPEKREAILDAAAAEFAANGYDAASINRILQAAGFSKGSFYYYFDDKADLAMAVIEREVARSMEIYSKLRVPSTAAEFWAEMSRLVELGAAQLRESPRSADALMRLGTALARKPELMERISASLFAEATAKLSAIWQRGQEVGAVRSDLPIPTMMALLQGMKMTLATLLLPDDRAPTAAEIDNFLKTYFDLIRRVSRVEPAPETEEHA